MKFRNLITIALFKSTVIGRRISDILCILRGLTALFFIIYFAVT